MAVLGAKKAMNPSQRARLKRIEASMNKNMASMKRETGKDSGKANVFKKAMAKDKARLDELRKQYGAVDPKSLKVSNRGMTPPRTLAKNESKVSQANMMRGKAPVSVNPQPKKKKALPKIGSKMGQMAYGGKVKKMKSGGKVSRRDGCAVRGKTKGRMV
jgi:hypothetical protein